MYDFATTPVAFAVNSMYLPLMVIAAGGNNTTVGLLPVISGAIAVLWTPLVGVFIDRATNQRTLRRLIILCSVLFASFSIAVLAFAEGLYFLVAAFCLMSIAIQTGWTAVNSYMVSSFDRNKLGTISGIGITLGYIGGGIGAGGAVIIEMLYDRSLALLIIAGFLLVFGLVPGILLPESTGEKNQKAPTLEALGDALREIKDDRSIQAYLVGYILWGDAVSAIVAFASVIAVEVLNIPTENASYFLAMALPGAVIGGYVQGKAADKIGLVQVQAINLLLWAAGITFMISFGGSIPTIVIALVAGVALGGNVALSRALYGKIMPPSMAGRLFGISSVFGFFGGAIGPLLMGYIADLEGSSLRIALVVPLFFFLASIPSLAFVKEKSAPFQGATGQQDEDN
jgi:UMF1 family MFS transporter